jgi:ABC-type microcin C transport system duplicated ATPase subunit YejF
MLLEVKDLKVYFKDDGRVTKAVDGIDFTINEEEVVGLVGGSGSGKSMTALSIMKLLPKGSSVESGEVIFERGDVFKLPESKMRKVRGQFISMIFQEPFTSLNPVMRVGAQIVEAVLVHKKVSKKEACLEAERLLRKVQIDDPGRVFSGYPHQLSGGQRQRVMIAMALAHSPKLLIADEPTTALDVTIQSEILKLILRLKKEMGMSILFITHDLGVVNKIADKILVMKDGKIVESGPRACIMLAASDPYTKKLIDAIPKVGAADREIAPEAGVIVKIEYVTKNFAIERGAWRKRVGEVRAVDKVSLDIKNGSTMGLVGESASGKTTLGRIVLGLLEPDAGRVLIEGRELGESLKSQPGRIREMMQIVFQDPYGSLDPHMCMGEIVTEGPAILGYGKTERGKILKDVLSKVSLKYDDISKYPHQFSGGERQRIAIARALAVKPKFLVLDEPVSSLDVSIQAGILKLLQDLQKELGLTYLFISHDLRVVGSISDEVAVMYKGSIVEIGPKNMIYSSPKHNYTKRLLSSIPKI